MRPEVVAAVLVLQTLQDYSDSEAMDALGCDIRWKVACGLPIDHPGFHPTTTPNPYHIAAADSRSFCWLTGGGGSFAGNTDTDTTVRLHIAR